MSDRNIPNIFRLLLSDMCIDKLDIVGTSDGFFMVNKSIANILALKGILDFPDSSGERLACGKFYDDWFLYAVPNDNDYTYSLLKLREQEHDAEDGSPADGDMPGVTISFVSFNSERLLDCFAGPTDENRKKLNTEINRVVAYKGQYHHKALKRYFKNPKSQGSYLVANMYTRYITSFAENEFVKGATAPMMLGNSVAVGVSIILVSLFSHERIFRKKTSEGIAHTFQRRLLSCIVIAYLITSTFTLILQNGMAQIETQEVFTVAINDVEAAVREKSNHQLLEIAEQVKKEYEKDPAVSLSGLAEKYDIKEINVVAPGGLITNSTEADVINNYDMNSKAQSKEFVDKLKVQDSFVQEYSPRGKDESVWRKYVAINLKDGGFIQVGYDAEQFHEMLNEFVIDVTKNRHVGTSGFVAVLDEQLCMVIDNDEFLRIYSRIGRKVLGYVS